VREVAKMFEAAGVSRTERSIVKWCLPNKHDVARLDAVFDANERKWFITQESVDRAIAEEQARAARHNEPLPNTSEDPVPNGSEPRKQTSPDHREENPDRASQQEKEIMDLKILNKGKDFLIEQLRQERDGFIDQLVEGSRRIGQLETELRQLSAPRNHSEQELSNDSQRMVASHDVEEDSA
jgi:hypothetical protein